MSDIFLSYKSEDRIKAQIIAEALEREDYSVWWDWIIPPGRTYDDVIEEELDAAKCVIVLWSKESVKSEWVRIEASEGKRRGIFVPVLIEEVLPPLAFRLIEAAKLIDWDGTQPNHEFDLLSESASRILGRSYAPKKKTLRPEEQKKMVTREKDIITNSLGMKFRLIPAHEIFLSYARSDRDRARIFAEIFEKQGYSVWWDRNIPHGRKFDEYILEKLDQAQCVLVLWSEESVKSDWVKDEAERGKRRKILVPVLIDDVDIPLGFGRYQTAQLIDWDGTLPDEEFELLSQSIADIMAPSSEVGRATIQEPGVEERQQRQKRDISKEEGQTFTSSIGMKFTLIEAGEFDMGSPPGEEGPSENEGPVHHVTISEPFYLGIYPVTQQEWEVVMGKNPSYFKGDDLPVENVSWEDVKAYIKKLNEKEETNAYRLPSEAECEYAARAGTKTRFSFGNDASELGEYAWYAENSDSQTHPVGQKKSNSWGLYDMHGNVWEWVQDTWHNNYEGASDDGSAWERGDGSNRVVRGGSWYDLARDCRSAARSNLDPGFRYYDLGFRLLREL